MEALIFINTTKEEFFNTANDGFKTLAKKRKAISNAISNIDSFKSPLMIQFDLICRELETKEDDPRKFYTEEHFKRFFERTGKQLTIEM